MKYKIVHEGRGRVRFLMPSGSLTEHQADRLEMLPKLYEEIDHVRIRTGIGSVAVKYHCKRREVLNILDAFHLEHDCQEDECSVTNVRSINEDYSIRTIERVGRRVLSLLFLPVSVRTAITVCKAIPVFAGAVKDLLKRHLKVEILEAASLAISFLTGDFETAGSVTFLIEMSEILNEWINTKKAVSLSETMPLNLEHAWLLCDGKEILVRTENIKEEDILIVHQEEMIPFDGIVVSGAGVTLQSSMTGNGLPVAKTEGDVVLAGTVLEEGELHFRVTNAEESRYDRILSMVDRFEASKPRLEEEVLQKSNALTPGFLLGSIATWLITRDITKASAFLAADFAYNLKMMLPAAVLSARKSAKDKHITVRGGHYMELLAQADTVVFDKTGTLTNPLPVMKQVISFGEKSETELIRLAACIEEHYPHIASNAIVRAAQKMGLEHDDMHSEIEAVVAHGVATMIGGKRTVIGSYHFVFEDEKCRMPQELPDLIHQEEHSQDRHLFLSIDGNLEGMFCIDDDLKVDAKDMIDNLRKQGVSHIVMLTGDCEHSAKEAVEELGIDEYQAEMLPEDKGAYIDQLKNEGHVVVMVGDGINDALALSKADVGIAMNTGAQIACEVADVVIDAQSLQSITQLRRISCQMLKRMYRSYRLTQGITAADIFTGVTGTQSANTPVLEKAFLLSLILANSQPY